MECKSTACDLLLANRVEQRMNGSKIETIVNRIRISEPAKRAGAAARATAIPKSVVAARAAAAASAQEAQAAAAAGISSTDLPGDMSAPPKRRTQKEEQEEQGGAGVYSLPLQHHWSLKQPEWVNDVIPEIMDGKNILDFVDPEIDARLAELEEEEDQRAQLAELEAADKDGIVYAELGPHAEPRSPLDDLCTALTTVDGLVLCRYRALSTLDDPRPSRLLTRRAFEPLACVSTDEMDDEAAEAQTAVKALAKSIRKKKGILKEKAVRDE
jgi:hypothetical protein